MYVWNHYGNVPVCGVVVVSIALVSWLGNTGTLICVVFVLLLLLFKLLL